jgi:hypothetical protein
MAREIARASTSSSCFHGHTFKIHALFRELDTTRWPAAASRASLAVDDHQPGKRA